MMADTDFEAQRALTIEELSKASADGFEVSTCLICKRPTLWRQGVIADVLTCGRRACMDEYAKIVGSG